MGSSSTENNIDILSFDGGGSRGIMELCILNDVMRFATIMLRQPETVESYLVKDENNGNEEYVLKNEDIRKRLIDDLEAVSDPIHPTDVYEMIVGTSTGALIAFALVGGKCKDDKRETMTVEECIKMYLTNTREIFKKSWFHRFISYIPGLSSIPFLTYSQDNVKDILLKQFGDCSLEDFGGTNGSKCVAGAVAKRLGKEEELVLFDTRSEDYRLYKAYQVLLASSNAPVYFDTPVRIGSNYFVDGGVGGNCPLAQAIPRAKELFGKDGKDAEITSALSVAPPHSSRTEVPRGFQLTYWLNYFVNESTDGYAVFRDVVKSNRHKTLFRRLSPRGDELKVFKLDEINAQKMLDEMEKEKGKNGMFLIDVIATAMEVVLTSIDKVSNYNRETTLMVAAQLAQVTGRAYQIEKEYQSAIVSYKTSIRLCKKFTSESRKDFAISKIYYKIAKCLKEQRNFQLAIQSLTSTMKVLRIHHHDNANSAELLVDITIDLAHCYNSTFRYKDAEDCLKKLLSESKLPNHKRVRVLTSMAWCKQNKGKFDKAVSKYREAEEYIPVNDNHERAEILNNVGLCFLNLGMKDKALNSILDAQEMRCRLIGPDENDSRVADSFNNVGLCFMEKSSYDEAQEKLTRAYEMYKIIGDDISISTVLKDLARCLSLSNRDHNLALAYTQEAREKMKKHVGDFDNPGNARILALVGQCQFRLEKFEKAKKKLEKAEMMTRRLFKSDTHPMLLEIYRTLSCLRRYANDETSAKFYETKANKIDDKIKEMANKTVIGER